MSKQKKTTGVRLKAGADITANEIIGRDKITHIHASPPQTKSPELTIRLFSLGRERVHQQEIAFNQEGQVSHLVGHEYSFGVALYNLAPSVPAKSISIRLEFFWRGSLPTYPLDFLLPTRAEGWTTSVQQLVNEQQAILVFSGPELLCFYGQPVEWLNFRVRVQERLDGHSLMCYKISSFQPQANSIGELKIVFA